MVNQLFSFMTEVLYDGCEEVVADGSHYACLDKTSYVLGLKPLSYAVRFNVRVCNLSHRVSHRNVAL